MPSTSATCATGTDARCRDGTAGAYITETERASAVVDLEPLDLAGARRLGVRGGGVDWGMRRDAHALAVLTVTRRTKRGEAVLAIVHA